MATQCPYLWPEINSLKMKSTTSKILSVLLLAVTLVACGGNPPKPEETADINTTAPAEAAANEQIQTLNAKFLEFDLGDASHYTFEDKAGKVWDFGRCEDKIIEFGVQLPMSEANETNQGWTSNKNLQGKWFDLKYVVKQEEMYIDGPVGDVMVILEAKMVQ